VLAQKIWSVKPAGIAMFGNSSELITDETGISQMIFFSRPATVYIWVKIGLSLYNEEEFPADGVPLVAEAVGDYIAALDVGVDVLPQRLYGSLFRSVNGVASATITMARTDSPFPVPDNSQFFAAPIPIADNERAFSDTSFVAVVVT